MAKEKSGGRGRKILGYGLLGLGALSVLDFFSPIPIPTVGLAAFASGALIMAGGLYVLYLRDMDWKGLLRKMVSRPPGGAESKRTPVDPMVPVAILKLAQQKNGVLTVSMVSMALNLPLPVAEAGMEECVQRGAATPEYDEVRGTMAYRFQEFLPPPAQPEIP